MSPRQAKAKQFQKSGYVTLCPREACFVLLVKYLEMQMNNFNFCTRQRASSKLHFCVTCGTQFYQDFREPVLHDKRVKLACLRQWTLSGDCIGSLLSIWHIWGNCIEHARKWKCVLIVRLELRVVCSTYNWQTVGGARLKTRLKVFRGGAFLFFCNTFTFTFMNEINTEAAGEIVLGTEKLCWRGHLQELMHNQEINTSALELLKLIQKGDLQHVFPNEYIALCIFLIMPATNASGEWSSSKLGLVKANQASGETEPYVQ